MSAEALGRLELGFGFADGAQANGLRAAAMARQRRQRLDRRLCAAKLVDQRTESCRPDILAADQSKPRQTLTRAEAFAGLKPFASRQCAPPRL
jgi:hypothetical protein